MKSFPMFLKMTGRRVVIAGGGEQAAQKARLMLKTEAQLVFLAPQLDDELQAMVAEGAASHDPGPATARSFEHCALVFIATGDPQEDAALQALAKAAHATVNVVDQPDLCDALTPSIVDRDPVVVAIGTEGTAPVLARRLKTDVEQMLDPRLGSFAALAGRLRDAVASNIPERHRRAFWRWTFNGAPFAAHKRGAERQAADLMKAAIQAGAAPDTQDTGQLSLIAPAPSVPDLLTLRAVARLQEADVIMIAPGVNADLLELARRDAERIWLGKSPGTETWDIAQSTTTALAQAEQGRRVVWICTDAKPLQIPTGPTPQVPIELLPALPNTIT